MPKYDKIKMFNKKMYLNESLEKYVDDLAAKLPAPGGGSATALVNSLASALNSMVSNFTIGNEKFKTNAEEVKKVLESSEKLRIELLNLTEEDVKLYSKVSRAYKLPKSTSEEKNKRVEMIQIALKDATKVPLRTFEISIEILRLSKILLNLGNPNLVSDVGVAACLAYASLKSSIINIEVNLASIKDKEFAFSLRKKINSIETEGNILKNEIYSGVLIKLNE